MKAILKTKSLLLMTFLIAAIAEQAFASTLRVHSKISGGKVEILSVEQAQLSLRHLISKDSDKTILRRIPYYIGEGKDYGSVIYEEYLISSATSSAEVRKALQKNLYQSRQQQVDMLQSEVRTLVEQGPTKNRINLTILGDGYTLDEKEKFFADAKRTTEGLFVGKTFASYLPLFNVYAVFVASTESGIGDGRPKNTAFKLYRDPAGSKRAIMPGNEAALERALQLAPATDYPIVLANDEYYGGLGGRYAISTSSERSGLIVLRHELGHNFGEVGEEYDNGGVYTGANSSRSGTNPSWKHWIDQTPEVFDSKLLSGDYVWQNLRKSYSKQFSIPAGFDLLLLQVSSVGWNSAEDVAVLLNGQKVELNGVFQEDRSFYDSSVVPVSAGQTYRLDIQEQIKDGNNVLGFAVVHAFPKNYDFTNDRVAAFSTYSQSGTKFYRPTHNSCLMRNMLTENFCSVDKENMWLKFLARVSLIDSLKLKTDGTNKLAILETQNLDGLQIRWFLVKDGINTEISTGAQSKQINVDDLKGQLIAKVTLSTPEVRLNSSHLTDQVSIDLK